MPRAPFASHPRITVDSQIHWCQRVLIRVFPPNRIPAGGCVVEILMRAGRSNSNLSILRVPQHLVHQPGSTPSAACRPCNQRPDGRLRWIPTFHSKYSKHHRPLRSWYNSQMSASSSWQEGGGKARKGLVGRDSRRDDATYVCEAGRVRPHPLGPASADVGMSFAVHDVCRGESVANLGL